jgi:O-antigen/teichoic acid export membrane protein
MTDKSPGIIAADPITPSVFEQDIAHTAKGGSMVAVGRLVTYVSRITITILLARLLAAEQYGMYNLAVTAAAIAAAVAVFGLDTAIMRQIAIMKSRRDNAGLWGALQVGVGTGILFSLVTSTALFALAYPLAENIFHEPKLAPLFQIASLVAPFLTMSDILAGATRGFKNMRDTVLAQAFLQPTVRLVLIVAASLLGLNVAIAIIIFGIADLSASILLLYLLNKHFSLKRPLNSARRDTKEILSFSFTLWLSDLLTTFRSNIQTLLLGSLGTIRGVGLCSVAAQANMLGHVFHASIAQSARPLIAELHDRQDHGRLNNLYTTSTKWSITLNLPFILAMVLFPQQILSIFGKSFEEGATVFVIMALVSLVSVCTGMCGALLEMTGQAKLKLINSIIKVSLAISLNFLLIPRWGIVGAAMAALIHEFVSNILPLVQVWFLYRLQPYSNTLFKPIIAGMSMLAAWALTRGLFPSEGNFLITILQILFLFAVYASVTFFLGFSVEEKALFNRFRRKVGFLPH